MTLKGIVLIVLYVLIILGLVFLGTVVAGPVGSLLAIILGAILSSGATLAKPFRDWLEDFVDENISLWQSKCRILIYGLPRSGKTSFIKRIITADKPVAEDSTSDFDVYDETLRLGLKNPKRHRVSFADYKGQKPSQILVDPPESFFGVSGQEMVNAILFVVDLFPEIRNEQGEALNDSEIVERYKHNANELIEQRVKSNLEYVNEWTIEPVFTVCYSEKNLFSVRLLINKIDLLRDIVAHGYLSSVNPDELEQFARKLYQPLEEKINEACSKNNIEDFSVHLVSASTGENIKDVLGEILEVYSKRIK